MKSEAVMDRPGNSQSVEIKSRVGKYYNIELDQKIISALVSIPDRTSDKVLQLHCKKIATKFFLIINSHFSGAHPLE